jgi:sugar lactone lactonase YvrE
MRSLDVIAAILDRGASADTRFGRRLRAPEQAAGDVRDISARAFRAAAPLAAIAAAALIAAPAASGLESCPTQAKAKVLYSGDGLLESIGVDRRGDVYFTDSTNGRLLKLRDGGRPPRVLAGGIDGPGGIAFAGDEVLVGFGNSVDQGVDGLLSPEAGLYSVDRRTGKRTTYVEGLQMANGVTRGDGGAIFASTDFGTGIDRVRGRKVQLQWATLPSPNGLIPDAAGKSLFAAQTFTTPSIMRIPFDDPAAMKPWYVAGSPADASAGLDGLTRGDGNTLYVAANGAGQIWRVDGPDSACVLLQRVPVPDGPSNLAFGRGHGIPRTSLLVTTFGGELLQLRHAR